MRRIIIHPGFPKTGTTALQTHLFPRLCNNLGWHYWGNTYEHSEEEAVNRLRGLGHLRRALFEKDELFFIQYRTHLLSKYLSMEWKNILLSCEDIIFDSFRYLVVEKNLLVSDVVSTFRKLSALLTEKENVEIKVFLLIRNQSDIIQSLYAQSYMHHYRKIVELNTIEKFIDNIEIGKKYNHLFSSLYYHTLIEKIIQVFGAENVEVLTYEDFLDDQASVTRCLSKLMNTDLSIDTIQQENVRREIDRWYTQNFTVKDLCNSSNSFVARIAIPILKNRLAKRFESTVLIKRKAISFNEEYAGKIFNSFKENNIRLREDGFVRSDRSEYFSL